MLRKVFKNFDVATERDIEFLGRSSFAIFLVQYGIISLNIYIHENRVLVNLGGGL